MQKAVLSALLLWILCIPATASLPDSEDLNAVLLRNVTKGFVDYDGIGADPAFDRYRTGLATAEESDLADNPAGDLKSRDVRLAFLINAYNVLSIEGILDGYSPSTWLGRNTFFRGREYGLLGGETTLDGLEKGRILPLGEPRVHFALVCASLSCPRLAGVAYNPATLDAQLDAAARAFVNDPTRNRFDAQRRIAFLSKIFDWYSADFANAAGSVQKFLARYVSDPAVAALLAEDAFDVRFVPYDWDLNGIYRGRPD